MKVRSKLKIIHIIIFRHLCTLLLLLLLLELLVLMSPSLYIYTSYVGVLVS